MKPTVPPDEYEQTFMGASGALARERVRMAWWAHAALALLALWSLRATEVSHTIGQLLIIAVVWVFFMTLRTVVSPDAVHVQLGVFGPRIPLESIRSVRAVSLSVLRTRGWGIRFGFDGSTTYSVPSAAQRYIEIAYERRGKVRVVRAMSHDPERLVAAIERARAAPEVTARVRVAPADVPARVGQGEVTEPCGELEPTEPTSSGRAAVRPSSGERS